MSASRSLILSTSRWLVVIGIVCAPTPSILAQPTVESMDHKYEAMRVGSGSRDVHYVVRDVSTNRTVLRTFAEFASPNDVKAGLFSPDSKEFAAAYHYGHDGNYTWVGIWDVQTGRLSRKVRLEGWVRDLTPVFRQAVTTPETIGDALEGTFAASPSWGSGWVDLRQPTTFEAGACLRLSVGGTASRVLVRLLRVDDDPNRAVGIVGGPRDVRKTRDLIVRIPRRLPNVKQISVHGHPKPFHYDLGDKNGPATLEAVFQVTCSGNAN